MQTKLKTVGARAVKAVAAIGVAGTLALAAATPSQARHGHIAAAGTGFAAGAFVGAAAANAAYGPGYGAYAYEPGEAYGPGYGAYAYAPGGYGTNPSDCVGDLGYGRPDYWAC